MSYTHCPRFFSRFMRAKISWKEKLPHRDLGGVHPHSSGSVHTDKEKQKKVTHPRLDKKRKTLYPRCNAEKENKPLKSTCPGHTGPPFTMHSLRTPWCRLCFFARHPNLSPFDPTPPWLFGLWPPLPWGLCRCFQLLFWHYKTCTGGPTTDPPQSPSLQCTQP